jgi:zinc protease
MRRVLIIAVSGLIACVSREPRAKAPDTGVAPVVSEPTGVQLHESKLPNGVPVYFLSNRVSDLEFHVVWEVGAANDPIGLAGLAGVTIGAIDEEIGGQNLAETKHYLGEMGAKVQADIAWRGTHLSVIVPKDRLAEGADLLGKMLTSPGFTQAALDRVKGQRVDFLKRFTGEIAEHGIVAAAKLLLGPGSRDASSIMGTLSEVPKIQLSDLVNFYARCLVPAKAKIFVMGASDQDRVGLALNTALADWINAKDVDCAGTAQEQMALASDSVILIDVADAKRAAVAFVRYELPDDLSTATDATIAILGGTGRRLETSLADKGGLAYQPLLDQRSMAKGRIITTAFETELSQIQAAIAAVDAAEQTFEETGPTADEMSGTKKMLRARLLRDLETLDDASVDPTVPAGWTRRLKQIDLLDQGVVMKAWKALRARPKVLLVYGPAKALAEPLQNFGRVTILSH